MLGLEIHITGIQQRIKYMYAHYTYECNCHYTILYMHTFIFLPTYPKHRSHSLEGTVSGGGGDGSLTSILMSLLLLSDERSIYKS